MSKDQWFRQFERELADGVPYEEAAAAAWKKIRDRALDQVDRQRKIDKGE